ncbi:HlyD family secretion protein [Parasphingopyxis marina]|uniref:HlyD family secretion protein n=1 Tax=Parasphingopyxis marina TaxID=2761622 RepID=A0A842HUX3_9SPHN|nr:HlyD family secretion protein [Parasphingopyxis marina]MBC2777798.1 HlyD family secretion protein [Parasphingopyxis marina]
MTDGPTDLRGDTRQPLDIEPETAESAPRVEAPSAPEESGRSRRRWSILLAVPVLLALILGYMWLFSGRYVSTDNAYVQRDMVSVTSQVSGEIVAVHVTENQQVRRGDLLFEIDDQPYRVALADAEAQVAQARVQFASLRAESAGTSGDIAGAQANLAYAERNFERYRDLHERGFLSRARYDDAVHDVQEARERLANARASATTAGAALAPGGLGNQPVLQAAIAARDAALLNLERTQVRASADGYVTQTDRLQVGNSVVTGVPVVTIVRSETTWIEANYKETDLENMYVGQPAEIDIDAYPGTVVRGHVASIGVGTGSEFSVLPAQNASGNWVKVTQRVPVRIAVDGTPERPLIAGLSATVTVDTQERPPQTQAGGDQPAARP